MSAAMEIDKENAEYCTSTGSGSPPASNMQKGVSADDNREAFSPELLRLYYSRLFPYEQVRTGTCRTA